MPKYTLGIVLALTAPIFHAGANVLDGFFANTVFRPLGPLVFFYAALNTFSLPLICLIDRPSTLPVNLFGVVFAIAVIEIVYQYPYLHALRRLDTSVVTSLFSLGNFLTPILALALVGENLRGAQYFGFIMIITSCSLLTFDFRKIRPQQGWWLMLIASACLSLQTVLYKYLFTHGAGWGTVVVWSTIAELAIAISVLLFTGNVYPVRRMLKLEKVMMLLVFGQILTWAGTVAGVYALLFIPVSVSNGLGELQAVFVLLLGLILSQNISGQHIRERLGAKHVLIKCLLVLLVVAGAWLISA